jgi:hypothetical protein
VVSTPHEIPHVVGPILAPKLCRRRDKLFVVCRSPTELIPLDSSAEVRL